MNSFYEVFAFAIQCAGNFTNDRPRGFLDKDYVEVWLDLENSVDDEIVLANVLWKNLEVFQNHIFCLLLSVERIDLILFSWISAYFFCCHSLLNQYLQKRHWLELAWWSPWQLEYLKECGHGLPFFVSRWGGFVFSLALQHHPNSQWFPDLWWPLHLTHLESCILQENVTWPHFQQFLHWGMPRFMLASLTVVIYLPTLKQRLIRHLALLPLWTFHISIHMIDMSDLGDTLIILGLDASLMSSKI